MMFDVREPERPSVATFCGIPFNDFSLKDQGRIIDAIAKKDHAALCDLVNMAKEISARSMIENDLAEIRLWVPADKEQAVRDAIDEALR